MYVDESGDAGLIGSPTRYFALSGLVVHESRWRDFIAALTAFRRILRTVYQLPLRTEIHASAFIGHRVHAIDGSALEKHVRLAILRNTLDEIAKLNYISVINVIVDKTAKTPPYDVFDKSWMTLFQRFENTLTYGNFPGARKADCGMVITDATAGTKLMHMVRHMAVRNYIPHHASYGTGSRNVPLVKIIEDPYGKDSTETLPIQMCDVIAYFLHQKHAPNAYMRRQRAASYFDRLRPVLNLKASRSNELGIVRL